MSAGFLILCLSCASLTIAGDNSLYKDEIRSLSELPLDKLIHIKSTLVGGVAEAEDGGNVGNSRKLSLTLPVALPLKRNSKKPMRRYEEHWDEKGKDTKISKIFQLAVTTLSFLAFGGYLLTLIISAIRRNNNNNTMNPGNVIVFSNLQALQKFKRPKRNAFIFDPMENDFNTEKMYQGMIMLSRSYAQYH